MQNVLSQLPFVLGNDSVVLVLEDQPFFPWLVLTLRFQAVLHRAKVDSVTHIFWPSQDVAYRRTIPGIRLAHVGVGALHAVFMNRVVVGWTRYAYF